MTVTTAPSAEACQVIVDRINSGSGGTYTLPSVATYTYELSEDCKEVGSALRVTVLHETEKDLDQTIETEQRTSHELRVLIRKRLSEKTNANINAVKLVARLIFQRLIAAATDTSRVKLWECNWEESAEPDKTLLREHGICSVGIALRVEVEPS